MPELPEVETIVRDLKKVIPGKEIKRVRVRDSLLLRGIPKRVFVAALQSQIIKDVHRRGKAIVIALFSGKFWVIQLKMTGQVIVQTPESSSRVASAPWPATRMIFELSGGVKMFYNDVRRFGRHWVGDDWKDCEHFRNLGPEPLSQDLTAEVLGAKLKGLRRAIKPLLLDSAFIAGIGNIYACEILFRAGLAPWRQALTLRAPQAARLYTEIVAVLSEAIAGRGTSLRNYRDGGGDPGMFGTRLAVYGREREACLRCGGPVARVVLSGRGTFYCGKCQK